MCSIEFSHYRSYYFILHTQFIFGIFFFRKWCWLTLKCAWHKNFYFLFRWLGMCKALVKRTRKQSQVENLGLLATLFGQVLRALALTCDDLRSLWSRSNLHASQCKFFYRLATQCKSLRKVNLPLLATACKSVCPGLKSFILYIKFYGALNDSFLA